MIGISDGGSLVGLSLVPQNYSVAVRIASGTKNHNSVRSVVGGVLE